MLISDVGSAPQDARSSATDAPYRPMRVLERSVYRGPHFYSATPMIRLQLDLGSIEAWPTNRIDGFTDRLLGVLPSLAGHGCSYKEPGGLITRMREGTWLGHVAEHIALELQTLAGSPVTRGKTRSVRGRPGVYNVLYAYCEEEVGLLAGLHALRLLNDLLPEPLKGLEGLRLIDRDAAQAANARFDLSVVLDDLRKARQAHGLGPTTAALAAEARRRGIPTLRLDEHSLIQLGYGSRQKRIRASITSQTSMIAVETAGDKNLTKQLLADAGLPVPRGALVRSAEEAVAEGARIKGPVVTKPLDGNHGRGVSTNLTTADEIRQGFAEALKALKRGRSVVVEEMLPGRDHRILVVGGEVVAVAERVPAQVVGDGASTIRHLIEVLNRDPRRGAGHEKVMTQVTVDDHLIDLLASNGLTLASVPAAGVVVKLRDTANLSTGGTAVDRTDEIHPDNAAIAEQAAAVIGLDVAGIDFLSPDISRSVRETGGGIVEVNAAPGFRMHLEPSEGRPRDVARPVLRALFPPEERSRIPIIAITGTNGKSTTTRMVGHVLQQMGLNVGLTSTSGIYVNGRLLLEADASGPKSARMVLKNPKVDVAVLETARGGILREGLGFPDCDVGAVLNVTADHLGIKGIDTLEDLAAVKSVVTESVHRSGVSVLNADDPQTLRMERHAGGKVAWFSMRGGDDMPGFLRRHIVEGGLAVVWEPTPRGGDLVIHNDGERQLLMAAADIPATLKGRAAFNIQNALAAVAICLAQKASLAVIRRALSSFASTFEQCPGRLNIYDGHPFRVILDYAHNPASLRAVGDLIARLRPDHNRVIGMVSTPGDRRDEDIREVGEIAAGVFDEIVFREAPDNRGRPHGQVNALMSEGALATGFEPSRLHAVIDEFEATDAALRLARQGDLVVLMPTSVEQVWKQVHAFSPTARRRLLRPESGLDARHA
jgi:cyanophycin synthetase